MPKLYIEITDVRTGDARLTNLTTAQRTNTETLALFESYRRYNVASAKAEFLLDLHKGFDLEDTILIDAAGFKAIVGREPESAETYVAVDEGIWAAARAKRKAA